MKKVMIVGNWLEKVTCKVAFHLNPRSSLLGGTLNAFASLTMFRSPIFRCPRSTPPT